MSRGDRPLPPGHRALRARGGEAAGLGRLPTDRQRRRARHAGPHRPPSPCAGARPTGSVWSPWRRRQAGDEPRRLRLFPGSRGMRDGSQACSTIQARWDLRLPMRPRRRFPGPTGRSRAGPPHGVRRRRPDRALPPAGAHAQPAAVRVRHRPGAAGRRAGALRGRLQRQALFPIPRWWPARAARSAGPLRYPRGFARPALGQRLRAVGPGRRGLYCCAARRQRRR